MQCWDYWYAAREMDCVSYRFFSMSARVHSPGKTSTRLRVVDISAEHSDRPALLGVLLDLGLDCCNALRRGSGP